jgi:hypothetical protein
MRRLGGSPILKESVEKNASNEINGCVPNRLSGMGKEGKCGGEQRSGDVGVEWAERRSSGKRREARMKLSWRALSGADAE